jgi:hypothetical protein
VQENIEAAVEVAVEEAMRISVDPLPIGPGNWQSGKANGEEEMEGVADE